MRRSNFYRLLPLILMLMMGPVTGCGTAESVYKSVSKTIKKPFKRRPVLVKKVLILPILDQAGLGEAKAAELTDNLIELIKKDSKLLVQKANLPAPSSVRFRSPRFTIAIDPDLAKKAEELGMNAMITCILNPLEVTTKRKGYWPFRRVKRQMEVSLLANAVDIMNGTLFLTNLETRKIKLPKVAPEEEENEKHISDEELQEILTDIIKDQAAAIIQGLEEQPWSGRVLSTQGKTIIINAGKDVGLKKNSVFEVYGRGESIFSASGRSLFLLGPKVGEIKTVEVLDSYSSATPLTEGTFRPGQVIKIIKN